MCSRCKVTAALCVLGIILFAGCSRNQSTATGEESSRSQAAAAPIDPNTVATITGTVKYTGAVPNPVKIDMSEDPACKGENAAEVLEVNHGDLANAFVYVKDGLGNRTFPAPQQPVELDQKNCRYHPHVVGIMAGQMLDIKNSDATIHNIHPMPKENREWNESQLPKSADIQKSFAHPEIMMPVRCNQHPWMKMYVNVVNNPFFAVTDQDGKFELKGLPPGEYTIAVVHERLGEQTQKITVGPKDVKTVDFTYGAGTAAGE